MLTVFDLSHILMPMSCNNWTPMILVASVDVLILYSYDLYVSKD